MGRRRAKKALKIAAGALITLALGAIAGVLILTSTRPGQAFVMEQALRRIEGNLNGEITISGLRSAGLDRGVRLLGLRLVAPDGSLVLAVDSAEAEYSIREILSGDVALSGVTLWRPTLTVMKEAPDRPFNLVTFLGAGESPVPELGHEREPAEAATRFLLEDVEIQDGTIEVRYPLTAPPDPSSRLMTEPAPDGQGVRRVFGFHGINGRLDGVVAADPAEEGIRMNVTGLSFDGEVFEEPVQVQDFDGRVVWSGNRGLFRAETVSVLGGTASGSASVELGGGGALNFTVDAVVEGMDLPELQWLEPRLPDARASGRIAMEVGPGGLRAGWSGATLAIGGGEIEADGALSRAAGGDFTLDDVTVDFSAVPVPVVEEFISIALPEEGRLSGSFDLSGTMDSLRVAGRMDLAEPGLSPTGGEIDGVLHLRRPLGVTGVTARLTTLDLGLVNRVAEGLSLDGSVNLDIQADGRLDTGVQLAAVGTLPDPQASYVSLEGSLTEVDGEVRIALNGELDPFWIGGAVGDESPLARLGSVRGTVHAEGSLPDLTLRSDLTTESGRLTLESRFDARSPFASYQIRSEAYDFDPLEVAPWLPEGTVLSGSLDLRGEGGDLRTAELVGSVGLSESTVAELTIDTVSVGLRISNGIVAMDDLQGRIGGVTVEGAGQLPLAGGGGPEDLRVTFETESLEGLRPLLLGANVIASDTLTVLERQILEFEGIDPDTLPTLAEVLVSGRMAGELTVNGSFESLSVTGRAAVDDAFYVGNSVGQAEVSFSAESLFSQEREVSAQIDADAISVFEREFDSVSVNVRYREPSGNVSVFLVRSPEESYSGRLALDEEGDLRTLNLDELVFRFPEERWNLGGPATISWDPDGLTFRDFRMRRPGVGGMRLQAQGRIPFDGEADFGLEAESLDIRWIARLLQWDEILEGVVELELNVAGTDDEPVMDLALSTDGFRFREYVVDQLEAEVAYADRTAEGDIAIWNDSIQVLILAGEVPLDLSFNPVEERFPEEVIDLVVVSDELPLSLVMAPFAGYEEVEGTLSGRVDVAGTSRSLAPQGQLTVDGGGAFLSGVGVRHEDVSGTLDWFPDGRLEVDMGALALGGGTATVEGTVSLTTALDPGFDLAIRFDDFQAMDRRDATGRVSGDLLLEGSFSRPVISGDLFLDEGTLFYEEFQRAANVADLFFERSGGLADLSAVDTTAFGFRPIIAGDNPFLQNIRMENTTMTARRNNWIRSEQMDVELEGNLDLLYDRQSQDLALVGALQALRGSLAFGPRGLRKEFQVDGGTLRFLGTPGINPDLDLTASEPVRTPEGDRLTIIAAITGTLISPRVALTSEEAGFNEDELLSYLWFGRPTYALTSDQNAALGAAGALGLNMFSNELGTVMTQGLGLDFLDYLSITQQDLSSLGSAGVNQWQGALSTTVVETGFYVADDMFLTLLFRPASAQGAGIESWPGIRFEWVASRGYTIQSYFEDQFFRGRTVGFGEFGVQTRKGLGLSIFRDWGY